MSFVYADKVYGPVPSTWYPLRGASFGYLVLSTIAPAPVATLNGNVASGDDRWKVTVIPEASTEPSVESSDDGPTSELIFLTRSKENFTSSAVIARPLGNVSPERTTQRYVVSPPPTKAQLLAASGTGVVPRSRMSSATGRRCCTTPRNRRRTRRPGRGRHRVRRADRDRPVRAPVRRQQLPAPDSHGRENQQRRENPYANRPHRCALPRALPGPPHIRHSLVARITQPQEFHPREEGSAEMRKNLPTSVKCPFHRRFSASAPASSGITN